MERLTEVTIEDGVKLYDISEKLCLSKATQGEKMAAILKKLADYEGLEEQGRLLKLPLADDKAEHRECVHTKATCHHKEYKCSECPLTELFCDEFYNAIDRCYEEAYASGCLAGIELRKSEAAAKLEELRGGENG